ncbi:DNA-directed RNA polymerase III subunit RPC4 [Madurella mycetomatis]|uniref:DNA-directed RNA polymerase III subunit RPC4 n=1 Tax=Madurella mycetomatis TaxID=100816 RepID=A0A175VYZ2_9PEZI|nr:DNA-directed RNA polymerase III subunit RPC4 [Madurella mycetomatis]
MPPRPTARGRGRGRGGAARGAAAAAASHSDNAVQPSESSTPAETTTTANPPASVTAATAPSGLGPTTATAAVATSQTTATSSSTPVSASAGRGPSSSKFKPKAVRRSEAERARLAEEQARIQAGRDAEEARRLAHLSRVRGRGRGRGRGGFLRDNFRTSVAAGPLSAGTSLGEGGPSGPGGYAFASGSRSGSGPGLVKGEGEGRGAKGAYGTSAIIDRDRINADMLYSYVEPEEEEDSRATVVSAKKKKAILPMGIRRVEHKEEEVTITTAAEIEAQEKAGTADEHESEEEGLFVGGPSGEDVSEPPRDEAVWEHAVPQPRSNVRIKTEDGEARGMDLDEIPEGVKVAESPEQKKALAQPAGEQKPKKSAAPKDPETEIIAQDLQRMLNMFTLQGSDGGASPLEGHMFLFQFPRILPPLKVASRDGDVASRPIKPEAGDDDLKEADGGAGEEEDGLEIGGYIGDLVVRKSGRVELSWGGLPLEAGPGVQANFLQTAVLIEDAETKPSDVSRYAGAAYGMGKVQGSFALAPIWSDEEDWVVDPKDLEIPHE